MGKNTSTEVGRRDVIKGTLLAGASLVAGSTSPGQSGAASAQRDGQLVGGSDIVLEMYESGELQKLVEPLFAQQDA